MVSNAIVFYHLQFHTITYAFCADFEFLFHLGFAYSIMHIYIYDAASVKIMGPIQDYEKSARRMEAILAAMTGGRRRNS